MRTFDTSLAIAFVLTASTSIAQISFGGRPVAHTDPDLLPEAPVVTMPAVDAAAMIAEDEARIAQGIKGPWRFGSNHMVDLGLDNSGIWTELPNGDRVWQLSIECPDAFSINFEFHDFVVPEGAQVFVHTEEGEFLGSFDARSNPGHTVLGVTQIAGDRITIEYIEPAAVAGEGSLRVGQVTHAYRDVFKAARGLGDSGSCNNNVICPEGDNWRDQIRSVAMITLGNSLCTGQLINNCENDGTPYFLTADHCVSGNGSTWVFRFNWNSPQCNVNQNGPTNQTVSGSSIKVTSSATDVALVELNTIPPVSYDVFYTGWDRSSTPSQSSTAIHHPSGDVKKISFDEDPATSASFGGASCWRIATWEDGTTEGGSSGSGLWNQNGLLVGQLYGGEAYCANNINDFYGRFDLSFPVLEEWLGDCGNELQGFPITTSIAEAEAVLDLEIHPNPTSGMIAVKLPVAAEGASVINIHDATGRIVHQQPIAAGMSSITMDLHHLPEAIYVLELNGNGSRAIQRLVLTH